MAEKDPDLVVVRLGGNPRSLRERANEAWGDGTRSCVPACNSSLTGNHIKALKAPAGSAQLIHLRPRGVNTVNIADNTLQLMDRGRNAREGPSLE